MGNSSINGGFSISHFDWGYSSLSLHSHFCWMYRPNSPTSPVSMDSRSPPKAWPKSSSPRSKHEGPNQGLTMNDAGTETEQRPVLDVVLSNNKKEVDQNWAPVIVKLDGWKQNMISKSSVLMMLACYTNNHPAKHNFYLGMFTYPDRFFFMWFAQLAAQWKPEQYQYMNCFRHMPCPTRQMHHHFPIGCWGPVLSTSQLVLILSGVTWKLKETPRSWPFLLAYYIFRPRISLRCHLMLFCLRIG